MSLVAYAASDDSERSDTDEQEDQKRTTSKFSNHAEETENAKAIDVLLKELPSPKAVTVDRNLDSEEEEELEDEVKPKSSQLADAPKPPPKKKQPVKITIPSLDQDSDEDEPVRKKMKTVSASGKSGLASLLPAPVNLSVKEANRVLIPYSLSKKRTAVNPVPSSKSLENKNKISKGDQASIQGLSNYYSDSDDEENDGSTSNFFSLDNTESKVETVLPQPPPVSNSLRKLNLPAPLTEPVSKLEVKSDQSENSLENSDNLDISSSQNERLKLESSNQDEPLTLTTSTQDEPLTFNSSFLDEPLQFKSSFNNSRPLYYSQIQGSHLQNSVVGLQEDDNNKMEELGKYQYPQYEEHEIHEDPQQKYMLDEEFLRLQGKKQRGREEINIVDVNADDMIGEVDFMKNITVETEHVSSKKKDGPTSQQKKKHQITYLAHQAKERELELKNQWSQNKMTKRQTQAKYGF